MNVFRRLFRIPRQPREILPEDTMKWITEEHPGRTYSDPANIPLATRPADPGEVRKTIEDTIVMPAVQDYSGEISVMRWQPTDEDVTTWALRNLRRLSPDTLAAGLRAYVQQHPVAA